MSRQFFGAIMQVFLIKAELTETTSIVP